MSTDQLPTEGMLFPLTEGTGARVVPIRIDGRLYGVPVAQAGDMVVLSATVPVAFAPASVRGVVNRQGRMATVIETRLGLGRDQTPTPPLIGLSVEHDGHFYILAVDEVREITDSANTREPIAPLDIGAIVARP